MVQKLIVWLADIYTLSDMVVCYNLAAKGSMSLQFIEASEEDHTLLDDFYHELQNELNNNDLPPIPGRELFEMSSLPSAKYATRDPLAMAKEIADGYYQIITSGRKLCAEIDDQGILHIAGAFIQKAKERYALFRDFTS